MDLLPPFCYVAESTLGKLCKWLRMAGLDTRLDSHVPDRHRLASLAEAQNRTVLTRTRKVFNALGPARAIFISADDPRDQIRELFRKQGIRREHLKPLSRCLHCNQVLAACSREEIRDRVPEHVLNVNTIFHRCPGCDRIFWPGSHAGRCLGLIDGWFER